MQPETAQKEKLKLVDPAYQPSKSEMEENIRVPAMSMEEAAQRLLRSVEIIHTEKPPRG